MENTLTASPPGSHPQPAAADSAVRPHKQTAATRERILDAALSVFSARGFNQASLAEIAARAEMTRAGILHHFGSKDRLLLAVLDHRDKTDVRDLEGGVPPKGDALLQHFIHTVATNVIRPGIVQSYAVLSAESVTEGHPAQDYFRERFEGLRAILVESLRSVAPTGTSEKDLALASASIIGAMDGLQVQWLLSPEAIEMPASVEATIEGITAWLNRGPRPAS